MENCEHRVEIRRRWYCLTHSKNEYKKSSRKSYCYVCSPCLWTENRFQGVGPTLGRKRCSIATTIKLQENSLEQAFNRDSLHSLAIEFVEHSRPRSRNRMTSTFFWIILGSIESLGRFAALYVTAFVHVLYSAMRMAVFSIITWVGRITLFQLILEHIGCSLTFEKMNSIFMTEGKPKFRTILLYGLHLENAKWELKRNPESTLVRIDGRAFSGQRSPVDNSP